MGHSAIYSNGNLPRFLSSPTYRDQEKETAEWEKDLTDFYHPSSHSLLRFSEPREQHPNLITA